MYRLLLSAVFICFYANPSLAQADVQCVDGLYMIVARATGDPQGSGLLTPVVDRILARINNSAAHPVEYPATFTNPWHVESIRDGGIAARQDITDYAQKCPGKIALLGYSQGAQVIGNSICGDRAGSMNDSLAANTTFVQSVINGSDGHIDFFEGPPISPSLVAGKIISVMLMGDPTRKINLPFDRGTARTDAIWPRDWDSCSIYAPLSRSYCDTGDVICDALSPPENPTPHTQYVQRYGVDAVEFVIERWNAATGANVPVDGGEPFPPQG